MNVYLLSNRHNFIQNVSARHHMLTLFTLQSLSYSQQLISLGMWSCSILGHFGYVRECVVICWQSYFLILFVLNVFVVDFLRYWELIKIVRESFIDGGFIIFLFTLLIVYFGQNVQCYTKKISLSIIWTKIRINKLSVYIIINRN